MGAAGQARASRRLAGCSRAPSHLLPRPPTRHPAPQIAYAEHFLVTTGVTCLIDWLSFGGQERIETVWARAAGGCDSPYTRIALLPPPG